MPVIDHPIHPSTQKGEDFRYGCWNRPSYNEGYWTIVREIFPNGRLALKEEFVPYRMSRNCKTAETGWAETDPACHGCERRMP